MVALSTEEYDLGENGTAISLTSIFFITTTYSPAVNDSGLSLYLIVAITAVVLSAIAITAGILVRKKRIINSGSRGLPLCVGSRGLPQFDDYINPTFINEHSRKTSRAQPNVTLDTNETFKLPNHSRRITSTKIIGRDGGSINNYGVELHFPKGSFSGPQKISLSILWNVECQPSLSGKETILSPIVSCEPHGLKMLRESTLKLPQCAYNILEEWDVTLWTSETNSYCEWPSWNKMNQHCVIIQKSRILVKINHFTQYAASGASSNPGSAVKKWVELIAFSPPLTGHLFQTRIYCVNNYDEEQAHDTQKVLRNEKKQHGTQMTSPLKLLFHGDGNNLQLEAEKISEGWKLDTTCAAKQEIHHDLVWNAGCGNCKFILQSAEKCQTVSCSVKANQKEHIDSTQHLLVACEKIDKIDNKMIRDKRLLELVIPQPLQDILKTHLDPEFLGNATNWTNLAEKMGKKISYCFWLEDERRAHGRSPTIHLLQEWVTSGKTLEQLDDMMKELCREDVREEIKKWKLGDVLSGRYTLQRVKKVANMNNKKFGSV